MIRVRLKVSGAGGVQEWREFDAPSIDEGVRQATRSGLRVLAIDSPRGTEQKRLTGRFQLLLFTQELLALLDAGLNVVEALETLQKKETVESAKMILDRLILGLREGKSFSDVLAAFPEIFPIIYIAGVQASERTGLLPETLTRFVTYQLQIDAVRKKVTSSTIYPIVLVVVGGLVTLFLLGYVVPKFSVILEGTSKETSIASRLLLNLGIIIGKHQLMIWSVVFSLFVFLIGALSQKNVRRSLLARGAELPFFKPFATLMSLARFYRTVSLLLEAGIPLVKSLEMSSSLLPAKVSAELSAVRERVRTGLTLSSAMAGTSLLTPIAESLIKVGERSGKLAEMMERIARFFDEELARRVDWFTRLFEPLLMVFIGLIIGMVVVLMYMPIFDLIGNF